jgi:hypothetical protein
VSETRKLAAIFMRDNRGRERSNGFVAFAIVRWPRVLSAACKCNHAQATATTSTTTERIRRLTQKGLVAPVEGGGWAARATV